MSFIYLPLKYNSCRGIVTLRYLCSTHWGYAFLLFCKNPFNISLADKQQIQKNSSNSNYNRLIDSYLVTPNIVVL